MADGRDMPHATFVRPDLGSLCRLDELGLQVVGHRLEPGRAMPRFHQGDDVECDA
jgi:hypothetical protein